MKRYIVVSCVYGFFRTALMAPPLEPNEYMTDRMGKAMVYTAVAPVALPKYLYLDMKMIEHRVRKMPGNVRVDRFPW
jgi:hypothetical protein